MKRYQIHQVWMYRLMVIILGAIMSPAALASDEPVGKAQVVSVEEQAPRERTPAYQASQSRHAVTPRFSVTFSGYDSDMVRKAFQEYARAIGQPVTVSTDWYSNNGFEVRLCEEQVYDHSAWGSLSQEVSRRARVDLNTQTLPTVELTAEIVRGNESLYTVSSQKTGVDVYAALSQWTRGGWANIGSSSDPQHAARVGAVAQTVQFVLAFCCQYACRAETIEGCARHIIAPPYLEHSAVYRHRCFLCQA